MLFLRIATSCKHVLLLPRTENDRDWTRVHGFLLGMRATLEGAAAASISSQCTSSAHCLNENNDNHEAGEAERLVNSPLRRETLTLAVFADDVMQACDEKWRNRHVLSKNNDGTELLVENKPCETVERMPCEVDRGGNGKSQFTANAFVSISDEPETTIGGATVGPTLQVRPLPPPPLRPIPTLSSTELAFSCLSHRQVTVREAAVGLIYTLATSLGRHTALGLYKRAIQDLQREKEKEDNAAVRDHDGSCGATVGPGLNSVGVGSRAETRRSCDRVRGLLCLLERIVVVLPAETVGETWERLFPLLR